MFAVAAAKQYMVGVLSDGGYRAAEFKSDKDELSSKNSRLFCCSIQQIFPAKLQLLCTSKQDSANIHKFLGVSVIVLQLWYFVNSFLGKWLKNSLLPADPFFDSTWTALAAAWWCLLLQVTSFQFVLPPKRAAGKHMIWQEWRAQNTIAVLRTLIAFSCSWYSTRNRCGPTEQVVLSCICFLTVFGHLYVSDATSKNLRGKDSDIITWPLWEGCTPAVERCIRLYYSIGVHQMTFMAIYSGLGDLCAADFAILGVLQLSSFFLTLVRKNIISSACFHGLYLWMFFHVAWIPFHSQLEYGRYYPEGSTGWSFWWRAALPIWGVPLLVYLLSSWGLSKYGCWLGFMVKVLADIAYPYSWYNWLAPLPVWFVWAVGQILYYTRLSSPSGKTPLLDEAQPRPLVLISRDRISRSSLYSLRFKMPPGCKHGVHAGQHLRLLIRNVSKGVEVLNGKENLEVNPDVLSRAYCVVSSSSSPDLEIIVKHYSANENAGFPQGGRVSSYLTQELKVGQGVFATGPHGRRIYFGNGIFAVRAGQPKMKPRICAFLAAGSGITPAIALLQELQNEAHSQADRRNSELQAIELMHINRRPEEALPFNKYAETQQKENNMDWSIPLYVHNVITDAADERMDVNAQHAGKCTWTAEEGELTEDVIRRTFSRPQEDVLVIVCGPHSFMSDFCIPLLMKVGYQNVMSWW
jgi:ferredoxin-NADP reductase